MKYQRLDLYCISKYTPWGLCKRFTSKMLVEYIAARIYR